MKKWKETREVLEAAVEAGRHGLPCAVVVLTRVKGSAYRRPGAKLLIRSDGSILGNVSGGCLENDLRERALAAMKSGAPSTVHYNTGSDEDVIWGLGLGCDGELDLLLYPLLPGDKHDWLPGALERLNQRQTFTMRWPIHSRTNAQPVIEPALGPGESPDHFDDHLAAPPELFIIGAGDDAIALVEQAAVAGFDVTVLDHRSGYLDAQRFPRAKQILLLRPEKTSGRIAIASGAFIVIKNHALEIDKKWAAFADSTGAAYIGILGPRKRCAEVQAMMTSGKNARVYGPAGLDLGSEGAEQIAASIVAEMLTVWSGRDARHLRERTGSIHGS